MTKIGTEVAHVIRDSDTTFRIKRSKVNCHEAANPPRLMVDAYELRRQKANGQLEKTTGLPSQRLAQEDANALPLSSLWRTEIARVMERRKGPLGLRDDDDNLPGAAAPDP